MFPIAIFGALAALIAWAAKPRDTLSFSKEAPTPRQQEREAILGGPPTSLSIVGSMKVGAISMGSVSAPPGRYGDDNSAPGMFGPPLQPLEERLLTLLILWGKDKKYPPLKKRYLNRTLLIEAAKIARQLGLRGTTRALLTDGRIPAYEKMGTRGVTVMQALVAFSNGNKRP